MLTNYAQVVQFYSAPLACFADALDSQPHDGVVTRSNHSKTGFPAGSLEQRSWSVQVEVV